MKENSTGQIFRGRLVDIINIEYLTPQKTFMAECKDHNLPGNLSKMRHGILLIMTHYSNLNKVKDNLCVYRHIDVYHTV